MKSCTRRCFESDPARTRNNPPEWSAPGIGDFEADLVVNKQDPQALAAATAEVIRCYGAFDGADKVARGIAEQVLGPNHTDTGSAISALAAVVQRISVMPGSRSIVLASPGFLLLGGLHAKETELMDRAIRSNVTISSLDARGLYDPWLGDAASSRDLWTELAQNALSARRS